MDFRLLGPLQVRHDDRIVPLGGYRQRLVLGVLLLHAERVVSTDRLIDAVWGGEPPRTARKTLQVYISRLRKLVGPEIIDATPHGYVLHVAPDSLDVHRFESLAASGRRLAALDPVAAAGAFRQSLALWRGMPWGELGDEPEIQPEAQRLRQLRLEVLEDRITADLECGRALGLVGELQELVDDHPLRERFRLLLMLALYQSGRQADALRLFQKTRRILGEELGIEPSRELQDLEQKILLQDPSIDRPETTTTVEDWAKARNPYKGLRPFTRQDAPDFFGRNDLVDELSSRIKTRSLIAVVGASGSGKSSAVLAGLLPRLQSTETRGAQDWLVITMVPGRHPFDEVTAAIDRSTADKAARSPSAVPADSFFLLRAIQDAVGDDTKRALLFVDQFEELFHQVADETERRLFLRNLVEAVEDPHSQLTVLVALRADYFDRALSETSIGPLISAGLVNVLPLVPADLEAAAARPAERAGTHVEPELIAELVADMTDQPGSLPLFQYVLTQLFEGRAGLVLSRSAYRRLGGLRGALARRAEDVYQTLDEGGQAATRQILLRMVTGGEDQEQSRRRVTRDELKSLAIDPGTVQVVLDAFDEARLLTFDRSPVTGQPTVEVAHEALLREWPRLRDWLDEAREDLRLHRALVREVDEWEASGRDPDYLLVGSRLDLHADRESAIELTGPEQDFIAASNDRREEERKAEEGRRQQELRVERQAGRRLRWLVAVVSVAALVATALTVFATNRSREASASQREARSRELANASLSNLDTDPELAVLLALQSIEITRATDDRVLREAEESLHLALAVHRIVGQHDGARPLAFHPDGGLFLGGNQPRLVDPASGETLVETTPLPKGWIAESVAVSDDGALLAAGTDHDGRIVVSDATSGTELTTLHGRVGTIGAMAFSPDSRMIAALRLWFTSNRRHVVGMIEVWDVATGQQMASARDTEVWDAEGPPSDMTFSPDGGLVAVTTFNGDRALAGEVRLLDIASSEWVMALRGHEGPVTGVEYLAGEDTIITASMDGSVRFWDAETGEQISSFDADVGQIVSMDVSSDGSRLLTGGDGGALRLWTLQSETARLAGELLGHNSWVASVDLDDADELGASVNLEGSVLVWNVAPSGAGEVAAWPAIRPVVFSAGGGLLATTGPNGRDVVIRRTVDWQPERVIEDVAPHVGLPEEEWGTVTGMSFSPEGDRLVTATGSRSEAVDGSVALWDTTTGDPIRTLLDHPFMKGSVAFSGDGSRVAAATCDLPGTPALVWEADTGEVVFTPPPARCGQAVDLDHTGRLLAVMTGAEDQPNVEVWDTESGESVLAVKHVPVWIGAVEFSPDGTLLLTGGGDGTARIWDIATGELVRVLTGHTGSVEYASWSTDGAEIITGSHDGTARVWDARTGETRLVLGGFTTWMSVDVGPDGRYLATGTDTEVRIWALDIDELIEIARTRVPRALTAAECIAYHFEQCP